MGAQILLVGSLMSLYSLCKLDTLLEGKKPEIFMPIVLTVVFGICVAISIICEYVLNTGDSGMGMFTGLCVGVFLLCSTLMFALLEGLLGRAKSWKPMWPKNSADKLPVELSSK